jgi:hypothetical protein
VTPSLFVYLANLRRPRRPGQAAADARDMAGVLARLGAPADGIATGRLGELAEITSDIADALTAGRFPLPLAPLNALAEHAASFPRLVAAPASAHVRLEQVDLPAAPAAAVAGRLIAELAGADLTRVRECGRPECRLIFYDDTRSRTQRWHAEAPCGRLERQRRHRAR